MFGRNRIVTPKDFERTNTGELRVTSIFHTIQGEGPFAGQPAYFVRLTGCNLQCSFCDTYFDQGDSLMPAEIIARIEKSTKQHHIHSRLVIVTGGEPMMQPNLSEFLRKMILKGYKTQIESNGNFYQKLPPDTHLVISPKINEKINKPIGMSGEAVARANSLKFVISKSVEGYKDVPRWALKWRSEKPRARQIYISPMNCYLKAPIKVDVNGTLERRSETDERVSFWQKGLLDEIRNQENHEYAAEIAMRHDVILSLQLHLYVSMP